MSLSCLVCKKEFSSGSSLNRHTRTIHSLEPKCKETKFKCVHCILNFNSVSALREHFKEIHNVMYEVEESIFNTISEFSNWLVNEEEVKHVKYVKMTGTKRTKDSEKVYFVCSQHSNYTSSKSVSSCTSQLICTKKIFEEKRTVTYYKTHCYQEDIQHYKSKQGISHQKYKCNECGFTSNKNKHLREHLKNDHGFNNEVEEITFENMSEFEQWLEDEQRRNNVQYTKVQRKKSTDKEKTYFECIRSVGSYSIKKERKRVLKSQGSCKMNCSCTSQIILTKNLQTEKYFMSYYRTHYGHEVEIQHLHLLKSDREAIASKLIVGIPPKGIINNVRDNISESLKRIDLLSSEDIKNIKKAYKIDCKDGCRHQNDAVSVLLWIEECSKSDSNPVLFYKLQGQPFNGLNNDDFCLILMNSFQKDIICKFGSKVITIDGTHGLNSYNFELTTILVRDEFGHGFPVAFMFSNRKDTAIYELFFRKIKEFVGCINTNAFMSDITNTFYNAWCTIMVPAQHRLYCAWHVDRAWQNNLGKINNEEKRTLTYKMLKYISTLLDINEFSENINKFMIKILSDPDTNLFGKYFQTNYLGNCKQWAYCYRKGCGINTNMHLESFHKTLKYFYLDGKKIKRLDKSINKLLLFLKDKTVERLIALKKGKGVESTIIARHRAAISSKFTVNQTNPDTFVLNNSSSNECDVVQKLSNLSCCPFKCQFCNICIHSYSCNCIDYVIRTTICKHVHYTALQDSNKNSTEQQQITCQDEIPQIVAEIAKQNPTKLKEKIKFEALAVINRLSNETLNEEHLKLIFEHQKAASAVSNLTQEKFEVKTVNHNEPGNKKIDKQISFLSTKKKRSTPKKLGKASPDELVIIREMLDVNVIVSSDPANDHNYCKSNI